MAIGMEGGAYSRIGNKAMLSLHFKISFFND